MRQMQHCRWLALLILLLVGSASGHGQTVNKVEVTYDTSKPLETLGENSTRKLTIKVYPEEAAKVARIDFTIPMVKVQGVLAKQALVEIKKAAGTQANGLKVESTTEFGFVVTSRRVGDFPVEGFGTVTFTIRKGIYRIDAGTQASQKFDVEVTDTKVEAIKVELKTGSDNRGEAIFFDHGGACPVQVTFTPPEATDKTIKLTSPFFTLIPENLGQGQYKLRAASLNVQKGVIQFEARGSSTPWTVKSDPAINAQIENAQLRGLKWEQLVGEGIWPADRKLQRGSVYRFCLKVTPTWLADPSSKIKFLKHEGLSTPQFLSQELKEDAWLVTYLVKAEKNVAGVALEAGMDKNQNLLQGVTYSVSTNDVTDIEVSPSPLKLYVGTQPSVDFSLTVKPENASDRTLTVKVDDAFENAITVSGAEGHYKVSLKPGYKESVEALLYATAGKITKKIPVAIHYVPVTGIMVTVDPTGANKTLSNDGEVIEVQEGGELPLDIRLLPYDKDDVTKCAGELTFEFPKLDLLLGWLPVGSIPTSANAQLRPTAGVSYGQQGGYTLKGLRPSKDPVDLTIKQGAIVRTFKVKVIPSNIQELFWVKEYKEGEEIVKPTKPDTLLVLADRQKPNILTKVVALGMEPKNPYNDKVKFSFEDLVVGLQRSNGDKVWLDVPQQVTNPLIVRVDQSQVNKNNTKQKTGLLRVESAQNPAVKSEMQVKLLYTLPTAVELSPTSITDKLKLGTTTELTVTVKGSAKYKASNRKVHIEVQCVKGSSVPTIEGGNQYVELVPLDGQPYGVAGKYQLKAKKATPLGDALKVIFTAEDDPKVKAELPIAGVEDVPVRGITLEPSLVNLTVGGEAQKVTVTFDPSEALNKELHWEGRWVDVERVSDTEYKFRAKANAPAGGTSVVATAKGGTNVKATLKVNIIVIDATSVAVETENPLTLSRALYEGRQVPVVVKVTPDNVSTQEVAVSYAGAALAAGLTTAKPISVERKADGLYLTYNLKIGIGDGERTITFTHKGASGKKAELKVTTVTRHVESFSFDPPQLNDLPLGLSGQKVKVNYKPEDAYKPTFTWSNLGNQGTLIQPVISVEPVGEFKEGVAEFLIKPLRAGVAYAQVSSNGVRHPYTVTIKGLSVRSMALSPTIINLNLTDNRTAELELRAEPEGSVLENLVWEGIYQHDVACVEITPLPDKTKHEGGATIYFFQVRSTRATDLNSTLQVTASCTPKTGKVQSNACAISVEQYDPSVKVESLSMKPEKLDLEVGGAAGEIAVTFTPADASLKEVGWKDLNGQLIQDYLQIERIKEKGAVVTYKVTPKKATSKALKLQVTASDVTGISSGNTCEVTVGAQKAEPLQSIAVTPSSLMMTPGMLEKAYIQYTPANTSQREVTAVSSSDAVTVSSSSTTGEFSIEAKKVGAATVTFKTVDPKITATLEVTVKKSPTGLEVLAADGTPLPDPVVIHEGGAKRVKVKVTPEGALQKVNYTVEPAGLLTVSGGSENYFNLLANKKGAGKVTFTTADGSQTKTINVKVEALEFTITYGPTSGAAGKIEVYNGQDLVGSGSSLPAGTELTVRVQPAAGKELEKLTVDGEPVAVSNNRYTFTLTGNMKVQASFRDKALQQVVITVQEEGSNNPIEGAKVILGSVAGTSDAQGIARVSISESQGTLFNLNVYKKGYLEYNAQVDLSSGLSLVAELKKEGSAPTGDVEVKFLVVNAATGEPIEGATVRELSKGTTGITSNEGKASLTVASGQAYNFVVSAEGYEQRFDGFMVTAATTRLVKLEKTHPVVPGTTFKLTVRVYDGLVPLSNAQVTVEESGQSQTTDDDGTVVLELPQGLYNLTVGAQGYYTRTFGLTLNGDQTVTLSLDEVLPNVPAKGGVVTLTVLDAQGPVAGAKVVPYYKDQEPQTTDGKGEARLTLHEEAHFNVEVYKEGHRSVVVPVDVTQGPVSRVVFLPSLSTPLPAGAYKLTVLVRDEQNKPVEGASVVVLAANKSKQTDQDGVAEIDDLGNGSYRLEVSRAEYGTVSAEVEIAGANARLNVVLTKQTAPVTPASQFALTVTVTDHVSHEALSNVEVYCGAEKLGATDEKGVFTKELKIGSYTLTLSHADYRDATLAALLTDGPRSYKVSMLKKDAPVTATAFSGVVRVMHYNAAQRLVPLEGVKVNVVGSDPVNSATSDAHGVAKLENLSNGAYQLELVLANFVTQHAVLQIHDADAELAVTMRQETGDPVFTQTKANITFIVKDEQGKAIEGATVTIKSPATSISTDARGLAVVQELEKGTYDFEVAKEGFTTHSGQLTAAGVDEQLLVVLKRSVPPTAEYTLTVWVSDADGALQDATVELTPASGAPVIKRTNYDGRVAFEKLPAGSYTLKVSKKDYTTKEGIAVELDGDKDEPVTLEKSSTPGVQKYTLTVEVSDADGALQDATVELTPASGAPVSKTTGADGQVAFGDLPAGSYTLKVSKKDYTTKSDIAITLDGDKTEKVTLEKSSTPGVSKYTLTVEVSDADGALQGATVELTPAGGAAVTKTTEADGKAAFAELAAGNYTLKVSKEGYTAKEGIAVALDADKAEPVTLEKVGKQPKPAPTAVEANELAALALYPNPVSSYFTVQCEERIAAVVVYNVLGLKVLEVSIEQQGQPISVETLPSGTYLVKVVARSGESAVRRIVKQ